MARPVCGFHPAGSLGSFCAVSSRPCLIWVLVLPPPHPPVAVRAATRSATVIARFTGQSLAAHPLVGWADGHGGPGVKERCIEQGLGRSGRNRHDAAFAPAASA